MDARLTLRRLLCGAAIVALVSTASACGGGRGAAQSAAKVPRLLTYSSSNLSFSYPAAWTAYSSHKWWTFHFSPLVYLSTQPVHNPCSTKGNETTCGFPVQRLRPGGVLAVWQFGQVPITGSIRLTGKQIRVDGHHAGLEETTGGECRRIGADRTIEADVELGDDGVIFLTACLRGPNLARAEKSVEALLASTRFPSQQT